MLKTNKKELQRKKEYSKRYREKHLDKDKQFFTARVSKEEGEEIKNFIKEHKIPIKRIIEEGTEIMWKGVK